MKKIIIALAATTALTTGAFAQDATTTDATAKELNIGGVRIGNPFDKSTWWSVEEEHGAKVVVNFTDPEFYINFFNPKTHSAIHAGLTNPADWAQMMKVETYANMLDYTKWSKWIGYFAILKFRNLPLTSNISEHCKRKLLLGNAMKASLLLHQQTKAGPKFLYFGNFRQLRRELSITK